MRAATILVMAVFLSATPALAHDPQQGEQFTPEQRNWLNGLKNKHGIMCCSGDDWLDVEWDTRDGHYRVLLEGKWYVVPEMSVIDEPNKTGRAKAWVGMTDEGVRSVRCFIRGLEG